MSNWIDEAQQRADAATAGPWEVRRPHGHNDMVAARLGSHITVIVAQECPMPDATFIASARADLPKALAAIQAVKELADSHDRYAAACDADIHLPHVGEHWRQEAHKARDEAKRIRRAVGIDQAEE